MNINSHILKISGNAELPSELIIGDNYEVKIAGTVTRSMLSDNNDGSFDQTYILKPVTVESTDNKGESIKSKDTRSESQLYRGMLKKLWIERGTPMDFEDFYQKVYRKHYKYLDAIINEVLKNE